jgi:hypothetical protein
MRVQDCPPCLGTGRHRCSSCLGAAAMAKVARHRCPRRVPSDSTHSVHLRPVLHEFAGVLCMAMGAFFLSLPTGGLFIPAFTTTSTPGMCRRSSRTTARDSSGYGSGSVNSADPTSVAASSRSATSSRAIRGTSQPLGFTPLAQSLARHASQTHASSRTRGNNRVADALRFAPVRCSGLSMSCPERAVNWPATCPAGPARPGLADRPREPASC